MTDFYVYFHKKATTGEIFYVGKGKNNRAYDKKGRSIWWDKVVNYHGFTVEIYADNLQEWYAFELEKEMITYYGRRDEGKGPLVNVTDGGEGSSGYRFSEERKEAARQISLHEDSLKRDQNIHTFVNINTREEVSTTRCKFENKYGISVKGLFKTNKTAKGWCLKEKLPEVTKMKPKCDPTVYNFAHLDGTKFTGTRVEFKDKYNVYPDGLFSGSNFAKGWYLDSGKEPPIPWGTEIHKFFHQKTGEIFVGTRAEFKKKYNLAVDRLFSTNPSDCCYGWALSVLPKYRKIVDKKVYRVYNEDLNLFFVGNRTEFRNTYNFNSKPLFTDNKCTSCHGWYLLGEDAACSFYIYDVYNEDMRIHFSGTKLEFFSKHPNVQNHLFHDSNKRICKGWKVIEKRQYTPYNPCISFSSVV